MVMTLPQEEPVRAAGQKRPAPRGSAAYPRKRAVTACEVCRARRTKCDNQRPACSFCTKTGAKCRYSSDEDDLSTYDPASLRILHRLDHLEELLKRPVQVQLNNTDTLVAKAGVTTSYNDDRSWLLHCSADVLLKSFETQQDQPPTSLLASVSPQFSNLSAGVHGPSPKSVADLDSSSSRQLLDNFFNHVHVKNPILQENETRRMVAQLSLYGADWSTESCLALLICALGSIATPLGNSDEVGPGSSAFTASQAYFLAAQRRLGACMAKSGLLEAQCLFLAGVYQMCIFRPFDAWRFFSQSLACCQTFSFLRKQTTVLHVLPTDSADPISGSEYVRVAEQSIYWSAWKSELELRRNWNMPDFSNPHAGVIYPSFFPTPPSPSDFYQDEESNARVQRQNMGWYFYLTEISLKRLMSRMSGEILHFEAANELDLLHGLADSVPDRLSELKEWTQSLPAPISLDTPPEIDDICKFVIRGHLVYAYEIVFWPFLAYYVLNKTSSTLSDAFVALAESALDWHLKTISVNRCGFHHRHHGTWFLIESCTRSVAMLLMTHHFNRENSSGIQLTMPDGSGAAIAEGIELNRYWQSELPNAQKRLPILESISRDIDLPF